ncbi:MAG: tyrosine--tRNA ligase [Clostridiales bacterium]|nr:tyrosine--tRNA ligase [Clostridiales bacterium]
MRNVYDVLMERGFIKQTTHEEEIRELLANEKIKFYIGFDPTADSLHVGHFLQIIVMMHMQQHGHTPVILLGGGTGMIGDPSGRSDMRKFLTKEEVQYNCDQFAKLFEKFIDYSDGKAIAVNNAEWLTELNYIEFLREIGKHFSVNRMLSAECYKSRMEEGLTFLEFNYMLMQSYDFYELNKRYDCKMQMGGDDQWSNIIGGVELIRKKAQKPAYGMTFKLLTTSEGKKMGKTQKGALWLDPNKTTPYEFYQYWRNVDDADVKNCLSLLTFLPMEEVNRLAALEGAEINKAKEVLAYEVTTLVHGEEEAKKAQEAARALFAKGGNNMENVPTVQIEKAKFEGEGMNVVTMLVEAGLVPSRSEGMRTVQQGGLTIEDEKIGDPKLNVTVDMFKDGKLLVRKGKKTYKMIELN